MVLKMLKIPLLILFCKLFDSLKSRIPVKVAHWVCVWVWGVTVSLTRHPDTVEGLVYRRYTPVYLGAHTWDGSRLKSV